MTSNRSDRLPRAARVAAGGLLIAVLGAAAVAMQIDRERRFPAREPAEQVLYVSSPAVMTRAVLSFDALAADIYWIRAIQYYGRIRLVRRADLSTAALPKTDLSAAALPEADLRYDLLHPLLDLTTSLDPHFMIAYRFGAFFLSERAPGGADRPDLAIRLLEKAIAANPDRWEYPHDIGFVYYKRGNYKEAADWFRRASQVPGATNWLAPLAAVTLATGGDIKSSRLLWQNILETADQSWLRTTAQQRLRQLDATETKLRLEQLTAEYERRHGDPPASWEDLVRDRAIPGVPLDPAGHPYVLNPWWGTVDVGEDSPMWPLPLYNPR